MIKQFAIIENNLVVNIVVVAEEDLFLLENNNYIELIDGDVVSIGFTYDNDNFIDPNNINTSHIFSMETPLTYDEIEEIINELLQNSS